MRGHIDLIEYTIRSSSNGHPLVYLIRNEAKEKSLQISRNTRPEGTILYYIPGRKSKYYK